MVPWGWILSAWTGQVASFMTQHLGYPIPSPAILESIGTSFRKAVRDFADTDHIPVVRFEPAVLVDIGDLSWRVFASTASSSPRAVAVMVVEGGRGV